MAVTVRSLLRAASAASAGSLYALLFLVHPRPGWFAPLGFGALAVERLGAQWLGLTRLGGWTLCVVLFGGVLPCLVASGFRDGPATLLLGRARAPGWRLVATGFAVALLPVVWIASRPEMIEAYARAPSEGPWRLARFVLVVTSEHVWAFGAVLGIAIGRGRGIVHPPTVGERGPPSVAQRWLGLTSRAGAARLDLDARTGAGIAAAAAVFAVCHLGKTPIETLGSVFAGFGLGWITWRARSVWPAIVLHGLLGLTLALVARLAARG